MNIKEILFSIAQSHAMIVLQYAIVILLFNIAFCNMQSIKNKKYYKIVSQCLELKQFSFFIRNLVRQKMSYLTMECILFYLLIKLIKYSICLTRHLF